MNKASNEQPVEVIDFSEMPMSNAVLFIQGLEEGTALGLKNVSTILNPDCMGRGVVNNLGFAHETFMVQLKDNTSSDSVINGRLQTLRLTKNIFEFHFKDRKKEYVISGHVTQENKEFLSELMTYVMKLDEGLPLV